MLPTDAKDRKNVPLATGCIDYFPDALAAVAECSKKGNDQHNPGQPLHWDRSKSDDEADALMRHFVDRGKIDKDGVRHSVKVAWRALALLQRELDAAKPPAEALTDGLVGRMRVSGKFPLGGMTISDDGIGADVYSHIAKRYVQDRALALRELIQDTCPCPACCNARGRK